MKWRSSTMDALQDLRVAVEADGVSVAVRPDAVRTVN